jgi:hypothetical protein
MDSLIPSRALFGDFEKLAPGRLLQKSPLVA